jgi:uracil-DNA glycosylase
MHDLEARCLQGAAERWPDKRIVFGEGKSDHPQVMLIGEAPGEQEALQGRPFVGKAGKNLDGFLSVLGLEREAIRISNVVKLRPTKESAKGRLSNRPPNQEELAYFTPFLYEEILLVQPAVLVTLGNTALHALLGNKINIGDCHGQLCHASVNSAGTSSFFSLFPLYHPASIIYNRALSQTYQDDLLKLKELLDQGI